MRELWLILGRVPGLPLGRLLGLLLSFLVVTAAAADTEGSERLRLQVFTSAAHPPVGLEALADSATVELYPVDAVARLEESLSAGLPKDPEQAAALALERLQSLDEATVLRLNAGASGLALARQHGLDRFPAVVIDGHAIVYGLMDLRQVVAHYRRRGVR
jgi:integrating conjugative element protein (TIGR03757 family)